MSTRSDSIDLFGSGNRPDPQALAQLGKTAGELSNYKGPRTHLDTTGIHQRPPETNPFLGRITGVNLTVTPYRYTWEPIQIIPTKVGSTDISSIESVDPAFIGKESVEPAYEANGFLVDEGTVVLLYRGIGPWYYFFCDGIAPLRPITLVTDILFSKQVTAGLPDKPVIKTMRVIAIDYLVDPTHLSSTTTGTNEKNCVCTIGLSDHGRVDSLYPETVNIS